MTQSESNIIELSQRVGEAVGLLKGMSNSISEIKAEQLYLRQNMSTSSAVKDLEEILTKAREDIKILQQEVFHSKSLRSFLERNWAKFVTVFFIIGSFSWAAIEWKASVELLKQDSTPRHHVERNVNNQ